MLLAQLKLSHPRSKILNMSRWEMTPRQRVQGRGSRRDRQRFVPPGGQKHCPREYQLHHRDVIRRLLNETEPDLPRPKPLPDAPLVLRMGPGVMRQKGIGRQPLDDYMAVLAADLEETDRRLAADLARRRRVEQLIEECRVCIEGDRVYFPRRRRPGVPLAVNPHLRTEAGPARAISGTELRERVLEIVAASPAPTSITDIRRLLAAQGLRPAGPRSPSQAISDVLRTPVKRGDVRRVGRNAYVVADERPQAA